MRDVRVRDTRALSKNGGDALCRVFEKRVPPDVISSELQSDGAVRCRSENEITVRSQWHGRHGPKRPLSCPTGTSPGHHMASQ